MSAFVLIVVFLTTVFIAAASASELCGQVAKIKPSYTISETSRRAEVSPLSGRLGGGGGRSTVAV